MSKCAAIVLDNLPLNEYVEAEYQRFHAQYNDVAPNLLNRKDYARWSYVLDILPDNVSILDIGVGAGQFIASASRSKKFTKVEGLDITKHSKFLDVSDGFVNITYASAADMPFENESFDYVLAMEMIEHLDSKTMMSAIKEIRRVSKRGIIITVPYCEKMPLPKYHKQRFDLNRIKDIFPSSNVTLCIEQRNVPWVCIEEYKK